MNELDRIIEWYRIPIVPVTYTVPCEGCGKEIPENDSDHGCCSFQCFCLFSSIDREDG